MKKIINQMHFPGLLLLVLCFFLLQTACKKNSSGGPSISQLRNYAASPKDTVVTQANPGQWVVIQGANFNNTQEVLFDGFPASFNNALQTNQSLVVQIPPGLALGSVASGSLNTLTVITPNGSATYKLPIVPPAPLINGVLNEMANPGDSVQVYGYNYFFIKSITYAGLPISSYTVNASGTTIRFTVPANLTQGGPIAVTTQSGSAVSSFNVYDFQTGVLCNFDAINNQNAWDNVVSNNATAFPDGWGNYGNLNFALCPSGDWGDWQSGRGIRTTNLSWVPSANMNDPVANWAVKFEINVANPWSAGCLFVQDWGWNHTCRYEPWKTAPGGVFTTVGWQTVTLPLSGFLTKVNGVDGTGSPAATVSDLLSSDGYSNGVAPLVFLFDNPLVNVNNFNIAIDNLRIVKIK